jgi:hypothetical protein
LEGVDEIMEELANRDLKNTRAKVDSRMPLKYILQANNSISQVPNFVKLNSTIKKPAKRAESMLDLSIKSDSRSFSNFR